MDSTEAAQTPAWLSSFLVSQFWLQRPNVVELKRAPPRHAAAFHAKGQIHPRMSAARFGGTTHRVWSPLSLTTSVGVPGSWRSALQPRARRTLRRARSNRGLVAGRATEAIASVVLASRA